MHDMAKKGRSPKGEQNGNSKLTAEQVREILDDDRPKKIVAKIYGVTPAIIYRIKKREIWKHV